VVSKYNADKIWVTCGKYDGTFTKRVFKSENRGQNWVNISGTLPNLPVNCIAYQEGNLDRIYIGTDLGIYYRNDTMTDWIPFNVGLPNVPVAELEIDDNAFKIWAGTFGRGLWSSDLFGTQGEIGASLENQSQINQFTVYPNPSNGNFTIKQNSNTADTYTYVVRDANGRTIASEIITKINSKKINLSNISPGIYFIEIGSNNNLYSSKIIIH
jgi:ligand-binding sensor domain-containing protein